MITKDEFIQRTEKLKKAYSNLESKPLEKRTEFDKMINHEIGNKLSSLFGFYELLQGGALSEEDFNEKYASKLEKTLNLTEKTIDLEKIKRFTRKQLMSEQEYSAKKIVKEMIEENNDYFERNNIQVKLVGNGGETNIKESVLYTALGTLFQNTLKFAPPNSQIAYYTRTYKDNFCFGTENYSDQGKVFYHTGLGQGLGTDFVNKMTKSLGGEEIRTDKPLFISENPDNSFYGTLIKIPNIRLGLEEENLEE